MKIRMTFNLLLLLISFCLPASGEFRETIGWQRLFRELGENTPTGAGIKVSLIESEALGNYGPDRSNFDFAGKTFTMMSGASGNSAHATVVGQRFFGNRLSMTGGIDTIDVYESIDWLLDGFLQVGRPLLPSVETSRIQNHSWVGSFDEHEFNVEAVRRLDYAIERDRFVAVVALGNEITALRPLLAHAYNAITVGRPNGVHSRGGTWFDEAGRSRPDIVAPGGFFTSYSAPVVSSATALLLEEAERTPGLTNATTYPQAIKAILLAGARKEPFPDWTRTESSPMDPVFGAGQLDIYNSYRILAGGEHHAGEGVVPKRGWSVGTLEAGSVTEFHFAFGADQESFIAHLSWHRLLDLDETDFNQATVMLGEFKLGLFRIGENGDHSEVQVSFDPVNNAQHLYLKDLAAGDYLLKLSRIDPGEFEVVHALAWNAESSPSENPVTFTEWQKLFFSAKELNQPAISGTDADPDGDGIPNLLEYGLGGNPRIADREILPVAGIDVADGSEYLSLTFNRPTDLTDVRYQVDASGNLGQAWFEGGGVRVDVQQNPDETTTEVWRASEPFSGGKRFLRLTVTKEDLVD